MSQPGNRSSWWSWVRRRHLVLLILIVLVKQLVLVWEVPVWRIPDETAHVQYTQTIVEEHRFPVFGLPKADFSAEIVRSFLGMAAVSPGYENYKRMSEYEIPNNLPERRSAPDDQPARNPAALYGPLYYLYESIPYAVLSSSSIETRVLGMRVFSSLLMAIVVFCSYKIAFLLRPHRGWATAVAAAVGWQPMLAYMMAGVNIDGFLVVTTTVALYALTRTYIHRQPKDFFWAAAGVGLAAMTKQPGWILLPLLGVVWLTLRSSWPRSRWWRYGVLAATLAVGLGYSWSLFGMFFNVTNPNHPDITVIIPGREWITTALILKIDLFMRFPYAFSSYWGQFGWIAALVKFPNWVYSWLGTLSLVAIAGFLSLLFRSRARTGLHDRAVVVGTILLAVCLEVGYQYLWWQRAVNNHSFHFPAHGRYYLLLVLPYTLIAMIGSEQFVPPRRRPWVWAGVVGIVILLGVYAMWPTLWLAR